MAFRILFGGFALIVACELLWLVGGFVWNVVAH